DFVWESAKLMAEQLVTLETGEDFKAMHRFISAEIAKYYPGDNAAFLAARQQAAADGALPLHPINYVLVPVILAGVVGLLGLALVARRRGDRTLATLAVLVFLAYVGNAFICGAVSNPADRYGNRIAWVCAACLFAGIARLRSDASEIPSAAG